MFLYNKRRSYSEEEIQFDIGKTSESSLSTLKRYSLSFPSREHHAWLRPHEHAETKYLRLMEHLSYSGLTMGTGAVFNPSTVIDHEVLHLFHYLSGRCLRTLRQSSSLDHTKGLLGFFGDSTTKDFHPWIGDSPFHPRKLPVYIYIYVYIS